MSQIRYPLKFWRRLDNLTQYYHIRDMYYSGWGRYIFFAYGEFDDWAAYVCKHDKDGNLVCALPRDLSYFELVVGLAYRFGGERIYQDMLHVFEQVRPSYNKSVLDYIKMLSMQYGEHSEVVHHVYSWLYYAMIAEENKDGTQLGGSIKMLALHRILLEGMSIEDAEEECNGMGWQRVRKLCEAVGIHWHRWV